MLKKIQARRSLQALALALVFLGATALPAAAHYVYAQPWTYFSDSTCEMTRSEVSHGGGGGYYKTDGYTWRENRVLGSSCSSDHKMAPGYKAANWAAWKWTGSTWALCAQSNYVYNSTVTSKLVVYWSYNSTPCGAGYYGNQGTSWHYNGAWYGGTVWSGYHYLPA